MKRTPLSRGTKPLKRKTRLKVTPSIWKWPPKELGQKRSKGKPTHYSKPEKRFCTMCAGRAWHADSKHPDLRCAKCNGTGFTEYRRLILSAADWQKMKREMWNTVLLTGHWPLCGICALSIYNYWDFEPDHIQPRGMGGGKRDDSPSNIQASHKICNREKGSRRI